LLSLHGRSFESIRPWLTKPGKVGFLTDPEHTPAKIADYLLKEGWPNCPVYLCEKLSYPEEKVICTDLVSTVTEEGFSHSVMVVVGHE
jgi:precorrin-6B methylase 1